MLVNSFALVLPDAVKKLLFVSDIGLNRNFSCFDTSKFTNHIIEVNLFSHIPLSRQERQIGKSLV